MFLCNMYVCKKWKKILTSNGIIPKCLTNVYIWDQEIKLTIGIAVVHILQLFYFKP